jgi:lipopolysaccharide assembly outer membrane protein LptD (OstA)
LFHAPLLSPQELSESANEQDIATSSFEELILWCRTLGLSESGTKEELAQRLRSYYRIEAAENPPPADRIITIQSARRSEYFTVESVQEEYMRLQGKVRISVVEGNTTHTVHAEEILFNRTRNMLTASGGVSYTKDSGGTVEGFEGESLTVNINTWATSFLNGASSFSNEDTTYQFAGTVISRTDAGATVLQNATISNAGNPEALWSVNASKIWLLPGSDFSILNAVLKVGEVPVFYWPFFYWPADEVVFHPVLGSRPRDGSFVQTTTYLFGRPSTTTENSLLNLVGDSNSSEKIREGLFLRTTNKRASDSNDRRFSILLDGYSNLGVYVGTELHLPKKGNFGETTLSGGLAFSRNVYQQGAYYTPFDREGKSTWNTSHIFGQEIPFRYRLRAAGSISGLYGSLNWDIPFYSDPFIDYDFIANRSESQDLLSMLLGGSTALTESNISSYELRINSTVTPNVKTLSPFISTLSVNSLNSFISFNTKTNSEANSYSPDRLFFYPIRWTVFSVSTTMSGTPLSFGSRPVAVQEEPSGMLTGIGTPIAPWQIPDKTVEISDSLLKPPVLNQTFSIPSQYGGPRVALDYNLRPSSSLDLNFRSGQTQPSMFFNDRASIHTLVRSEGSVGVSLTQPEGGLYSSSARISASGAWQDYPYINEEAEEFDTEAERAAAWRTAYNNTFFSSLWEYNATVKPFFFNSYIKNSTLQYTVKGPVTKTVFSGTGTDPQWDWEQGDLTEHRVTTNLTTDLFDKSQSIILITDVPPIDPTFSWNGTLRFGPTETIFQGKMMTEGEKRFDPFYFSEKISFGPQDLFTFQQLITYDPEQSDFTNMTSVLSVDGFSARFTAARIKQYELNNMKGWVLKQPEEEVFMPSAFRADFVRTITIPPLWDNKITSSINLNTSLNIDLQRYTYSNLSFNLGFKVVVNNFIDLTFNSVSENSQIFRYFNEIPEFGLEKKNFFVDLFNSFRFDNSDLRRDSAFKLKSLNLNIVHHLGDWDATLGIQVAPYLENRAYNLNTTVSFLVQWKPIPEIKATIEGNKDGWGFDPIQK